jgi:hypothetical protein
MKVSTPITRQIVKDQPHAEMERLLGLPIRLELIVRGFLLTMTKGYPRFQWQFNTLSNGGCYVAPLGGPTRYTIVIGQRRRIDLAPDSAGIVGSLLAFSYLSFSMDLTFAESCDRQYSLLRQYALEHHQAARILETTR